VKRSAGDSHSANHHSARKLSASLLARGAWVYDSIAFVLEFHPCVNRAATTDSILAGSDNKSPLPLGNSVPANTDVQV
jgi:hypothetical protein